MARYTGPKRRLERREGTSLFGSEKWQKRPNQPGQHPISRGRPSEYAVQFREKQKVKRIYGVLERQFQRIVRDALDSEGNSGTALLQYLELRLDNVVYRLGLAKTRMQARQFVNHGHVDVNGAKVDVPSFRVRVGDKITLRKKIVSSDAAKAREEELAEAFVPEWLESSKNGGKVKGIPKRSELDQSIEERLIIEFYSRKL
ncbi:MAG: 30S ribosomal protein S4 [Candidatus Dojkabacteria bacterium]